MIEGRAEILLLFLEAINGGANAKKSQLVTLLRSLGPWRDSIFLVAGLTPGYLVPARIRAGIDEEDPHTVNVFYPAAFSVGCICPAVRLEIGPLASWIPSNTHNVQAYAAQVFPGAFSDSVCAVVAIDAERTFWEKATILHQEAHRPETVPSRYSRHYYDLYKLSESPIKQAALSNLTLLRSVVEFKERFYYTFLGVV